MNELDSLVDTARAAFAHAKTPADLENAKALFLGKAGRITELMKGMAQLPVDEKKSRGAAINGVKQAIESALESATIKHYGEESEVVVRVSRDDGTISGRIGKDVFSEMITSGQSPREIVTEKGWQQVTDNAGLTPLIDRVIADHGDKVAQYRDGKTALLGFFVGQVMKASRGQANPQRLNEMLRDRLGSD